MYVEFLPYQDLSYEELGGPIDADELDCGIFRLHLSDCIEVMNAQFENYAHPTDGILLAWLQRHEGSTSGSNAASIPDDMRDRATYMVASLMDAERVSHVECKKCDTQYKADMLQRNEWDERVDASGICVGSAGFHFDCPSGHILLTVTVKLY